MSNGKDIRKAQKAIKAGKPFVDPYKQDVLYTNMGQWMYPGQVTKIPSNQITMQGVNYPVQGVDDTGYSQMMYPGMDYTFPGQYVTEYPQIQTAQYGGGYIPVGYYPSYNNSDGSYSNEVSVGMNIDDQEMLLPSFWEGSRHTDDETKTRYKKTGEHLGAFKNVADAERAAQLREFMNNEVHPYSKKYGGWLDDYQVGGAEKRKIPQSGIVVDKRTNIGYAMGDDGNTRTFNVLTGQVVDMNKDYSYDQVEKNPKLRGTPAGYYLLKQELKKIKGDTNDKHYKNKIRYLEPLSAFGEKVNSASDLAFHRLYSDNAYNSNDKEFNRRKALLNQSDANKRCASWGCTNVDDYTYDRVNKMFPKADTLMVIDSKRPKDLALLNQTKKRMKASLDQDPSLAIGYKKMGGWLDAYEDIPKAQLGKFFKAGLKKSVNNASKTAIKKVVNIKYELPSKEKLKDLHGFLPRRQFIKDLQKKDLIGKDFKDLNYAASSTEKTNALTKLALNKDATRYRGVQGKVPKDGIARQESHPYQKYDMSKPAWNNKISEFENMKNAGVDFNDPLSIAKYQATHIPMQQYGYRSGLPRLTNVDALYSVRYPDPTGHYGNYQMKITSPRDYSIGDYKDWFNKYHNPKNNLGDLAVKDGYYINDYIPNTTYEMPVGLSRNDMTTVVGKRGKKMFDVDESFPFMDVKNLNSQKQLEFGDYVRKLKKDFDTGWEGQYQNGGWLDDLDTYQTAGQVTNRQDNTRVVIPNLPKGVSNEKNSFKKDWLSDAYEEDENVKLQKKEWAKKYQAQGLSKDQAKLLAEDAYRNVEHNKSLKETIPESTFEQHVPQDLTSKTFEVLANPLLAMKQYKGHRLPDHFSSAEEDIISPVNISNLGYQFLTGPGKLAFSSELGNEAINNIKEGEYLQAGLNAAFAIPGVKVIKDAIKYKNKLKRVANIKEIKNNKKILPDTERGKIEGLGYKNDIEQLNIKPTYENNPYTFRDPYTNETIYQTDPADFENFADAEQYYKKASNQWLNNEGLKRSGSTDVPQFNQQVKDLSTQMQFGKRSIPTQEQFYTTKELNNLKKQHNDYYSALDEYEKANPQNGSDMMMSMFSGNNPYMNTFHNLNPNVVKPNFGEKFIANQEYSKMLNKNFPYAPGVRNSLSPSSLKFIGSNENKLLPSAKNLVNRADDWFHKANKKDYLIEMRGSSGLKLDDIKNMSAADIEMNAQKIYDKMGKQQVDMYLKDVSTPYTGKQAFNDIQPNKYGGDLQEAQWGKIVKAGLKGAKAVSKPANKILKNNIIKPINEFLKPIKQDFDKVIVPIQFRKDIRKLKEKAAKQHEYFERPEVVEKLKSLKVSPQSISNLQRPNQIELSFEPNVGSYFDQSSGAINIDMRQIKEGAERFGMTPSQVYEHELGHHIQQVINAGSPEHELAYNKYKAALQDYNIRKELSKRRAGISSNLDPMAVRNKPDFLADWGMPVFPKALAKPTILDKQAAGMLRIKAKNKKILTPEEKKILNYYHSETIDDELLTKIGYDIENGTERVPHLREMRQAMLEKNYITDVSDPITEDILKKFIKENPKNRISQIIDPNIETNYKKLVKTFKHLPAVAPVGLGAAAALDQEKLGGQRRLKRSTSKNIQSSINDLMLRNDLMQRNQTLFGPAGKRRYKPGLKYKEGGWLNQFDK